MYFDWNDALSVSSSAALGFTSRPHLVKSIHIIKSIQIYSFSYPSILSSRLSTGDKVPLSSSILGTENSLGIVFNPNVRMKTTDLRAKDVSKGGLFFLKKEDISLSESYINPNEVLKMHHMVHT